MPLGFFPSSLLRLVCFASLLMFSVQSHARSAIEVQAAYLYNFTKFIDWPNESGQNEITICVLGQNPFSAFKEKFQERKVRGKDLRFIDVIENDFSECSVLFVSSSEENFYRQVLGQLSPDPVLTVSDINGFIGGGGMIAFKKVGNVVRFDINLKQARQAGLNISAKLLKLADEVEQ